MSGYWAVVVIMGLALGATVLTVIRSLSPDGTASTEPPTASFDAPVDEWVTGELPESGKEQ